MNDWLKRTYGDWYSDKFHKAYKAMIAYPKAVIDWFRGRRQKTSQVTAEFIEDTQKRLEEVGLSGAMEAGQNAVKDVLNDGPISTAGNYARAPFFNVMGMPPIKRTPLEIFQDKRRNYQDWFMRRSERYFGDIQGEYESPCEELREILT